METEQKNQKWIKWTKKAKVECKKCVVAIANIEKNFEETDKKMQQLIKESKKDELFINTYLSKSEIFEVADCINEMKNGTKENEYSETTREIAQSVADKIPNSVPINVNTAFRYSKNDVDDVIMEKTFRKVKIELSRQIYDEVKFMVKQFEEKQYDLENPKDLYNILTTTTSINYALNKIDALCPGSVGNDSIYQLKVEIDYGQINYLGVQYRELLKEK